MRHELRLGRMGETVADRWRELKELEAIERQIAERKGHIAAADDRAKTQDPAEDLACRLHSSLCHWNHVDGCGWDYEIHRGLHNWKGHAHANYLARAKKLLAVAAKKNVEPETLIDLMDEINGY